MKRRTFLKLSSAFIARPAFAASPWAARLLLGATDPQGADLGLHITLADKWKTYWRVPGDGGIPPDIVLDPRSQNIASLTFQFPVPSRFFDAAGETIGYKNEVVFPIRLTAIDGVKPMRLNLASFFGVCDEVCIPARFEQEVEVKSGASGADARVVAQWLALVPTAASPIKSASLRDLNGAPHLALEISTSVEDIFVESTTNAYFKNPDLSTANLALLPIANLKTPTDLVGQTLRITCISGGKGLEQFIDVR
jgi:DsbC/DsbD-like thiol-disulfide interchange protein